MFKKTLLIAMMISLACVTSSFGYDYTTGTIVQYGPGSKQSSSMGANQHQDGYWYFTAFVQACNYGSTLGTSSVADASCCTYGISVRSYDSTFQNDSLSERAPSGNFSNINVFVYLTVSGEEGFAAGQANATWAQN